MILLDTSILSLAFRRRKAPHALVENPVGRLEQLVDEDAPLAVPGIVLQELLSGLASIQEFDRLEKLMLGFPVVLADVEDHLAAAAVANSCRRVGIATSSADCLIAALSIGRRAQLLTLDKDFTRIASCTDLVLFGAA